MGHQVGGVGALLAVLLCACGEAPRLPAGTPVVLVVVDTLRADRLGAYGYERPTSPEIDAWTQRGVLFERALSTAPWTLPSVASILTGLLPDGHGAGRFKVKKGGKERWVKVGLDASVPTLASRLGEAGYSSGGFVTNSFLQAPFGLHAGFETYDSKGHKGASARPADTMVDAALEWLDAHRSEPFLLFLHLMDPHLPYSPRPPARGRFAEDRAGRLSVPVDGLRSIRYARPPLDEEERSFVSSLYDEEVAYVDVHVGRFLEGLAARGLMDEALVILCSDHGEELWEHGSFEHGHSLYQELLHVPLVFWAPGLTPARIETAVSLVDVLPTILEALGLVRPAGLDGASLWSAIRTGDAPEPRPLLAHDTLRGADRQALVAWPWKLVVNLEKEDTRLYDLASDPGETRDRSGADPERVETLRTRLRQRLRADTTARHGRQVELDEDLKRELRALGYAEDEP